MSSSRDSFMNALSMNGGDGELSYASNSRVQIWDVLQDKTRFWSYSQIVNTIITSYQQKSQNPPEIDYCLNDLPENDFNTTFKLVPSFSKEVKGKCYVSGVPGSFYSRLFPKKSLDFLHSSYSIHWLSKMPQGLEDNENNVYIRSGCSLDVCKSYMNQFQNDFSLFLRLRSEEMLPSGRMVLTVAGKKDLDPLFRDGFPFTSLLSDALVDLVSEGVVKKSEADSFNLPFYIPNEGEVREIVENEGSFEINKIETFEFPVSYEIYYEDGDYSEESHRLEVGRKMANVIRAITEPLLVAHFGDSIIINRVFDKFAHRASQDYVSLIRETTFSIMASFTRK